MDLSTPIATIIPSLEGRALDVLAGTSLPLTGSAVARLVPGSSNSGVRVALARLVSSGLVRSEHAGAAILYRANREHVLWDPLERLLDSARQAPLRIDTAILEIVQAHEPQPICVAFYGSYARGEAGPSSDVDIVMVFAELPSTAELLCTAEVERVIPTITGNRCHVYETSRTGLEELVARNDPILESWRRDARSIVGDLRTLIAQAV